MQISLHRCPRCGKGYRHRHHMLFHERVECGKSPQLRCHICGHATKRMSNLRAHVARHH